MDQISYPLLCLERVYLLLVLAGEQHFNIRKDLSPVCVGIDWFPTQAYRDRFQRILQDFLTKKPIATMIDEIVRTRSRCRHIRSTAGSQRRSRCSPRRSSMRQSDWHRMSESCAAHTACFMKNCSDSSVWGNYPACRIGKSMQRSERGRTTSLMCHASLPLALAEIAFTLCALRANVSARPEQSYQRDQLAPVSIT